MNFYKDQIGKNMQNYEESLHKKDPRLADQRTASRFNMVGHEN